MIYFKKREKYGSQSVVELLLTQRNGSSLYCRFAIKKQFGLTDPQVIQKKSSIHYDLLRTPYHLLYAWGDAVTSDGEKGYKVDILS
jgi:hypothetical protein